MPGGAGKSMVGWCGKWRRNHAAAAALSALVERSVKPRARNSRRNPAAETPVTAKRRQVGCAVYKAGALRAAPAEGA